MKDDGQNHFSNLTEKKLLAENTILNFCGQLFPIVTAVVCMPRIIHGLGTERFGILTIAWTFIGYFSLFDLGLGRAVTQMVSKKIGSGDLEEVPALIWTALILLVAFGSLGSLVAFFSAPMMVSKVIKVSKDMQQEALYCFYIMSAAIPFVVSSDTFNGILESKQKFGLTNFIRTPQGVLNYLGPVILMFYTHKVYWIVALLAVLRISGTFVLAVVCIVEIPSLKNGFKFETSRMKQLLGFGSWMTVSNIISPLMVSFDRFLIGSFISLTAITYYSTPFDVANRLYFFSVPLTKVLFPAFSQSHAQNRGQSVRLFEQGIKVLMVMMFPIILTAVLFSKEGLDLWIGPSFSEHSATVLKLISIGIFVSVLSQIPFSFLQGIGRPDLTAKNHLAEFPFYCVLLFILMNYFGINGVALAWLLRVFVDMVLLYWETWHLVPESRAFIRKFSLEGNVFFMVLIAAVFVSLNWTFKILIDVFLVSFFMIFAWKWLFNLNERNFIKHFLGDFRVSVRHPI